MNAVFNSNNNCNCELCAPNWHLGEDGDFLPLTEEEQAEQKKQEQEQEAAELSSATPLVFTN